MQFLEEVWKLPLLVIRTYINKHLLLYAELTGRMKKKKKIPQRSFKNYVDKMSCIGGQKMPVFIYVQGKKCSRWDKGQIKPKADWHAVDSAKNKGTNLFSLLFCFSQKTKQISSFIFWKNLQLAQTAFGFIWPLGTQKGAKLCPRSYWTTP